MGSNNGGGSMGDFQWTGSRYGCRTTSAVFTSFANGYSSDTGLDPWATASSFSRIGVGGGNFILLTWSRYVLSGGNYLNHFNNWPSVKRGVADDFIDWRRRHFILRTGSSVTCRLLYRIICVGQWEWQFHSGNGQLLPLATSVSGTGVGGKI